MRTLKYITMMILAGFVFTSCVEDELELDPQQSLSDGTAFSTAATARGTVIGVYHLAQDLDVFGGMPQVVNEYMADNVNFVGTFPTLQDINNFGQLADNGSITTWWTESYELIASANIVVDNIPTVTDPQLTPEEGAALIGEAKFLRAMTYFHMLNLWAQPVQVNGGGSLGLPLILQAFDGDPTSVNLPRSTVEAVHQQIITDLEDAIASLPAEYATATETRGRATQGAARALLSRVRLYRGEWQAAADLANQVIQSSTYALASDLTFYDQLTPEDVFTLVNTVQDNGATGSGGWDNYYNGSVVNGRGDAPFSQNLVDAFEAEPGDLRFDLKVVGVDAQTNNSFFTDKYDDALNDDSDAPLIRIAEMYLNRAEALAELGQSAEALTMVNAIRNRAGLGDLSGLSGQALIDAILLERRKELAFEGHRRMDLLRRGLPLRTAASVPASVGQGTGAGIGAGDDKAIMGIPQNQVDLSEGVLQQNPGFGGS